MNTEVDSLIKPCPIVWSRDINGRVIKLFLGIEYSCETISEDVIPRLRELGIISEKDYKNPEDFCDVYTLEYVITEYLKKQGIELSFRITRPKMMPSYDECEFHLIKEDGNLLMEKDINTFKEACEHLNIQYRNPSLYPVLDDYCS